LPGFDHALSIPAAIVGDDAANGSQLDGRCSTPAPPNRRFLWLGQAQGLVYRLLQW